METRLLEILGLLLTGLVVGTGAAAQQPCPEGTPIDSLTIVLIPPGDTPLGDEIILQIGTINYPMRRQVGTAHWDVDFAGSPPILTPATDLRGISQSTHPAYGLSRETRAADQFRLESGLCIGMVKRLFVSAWTLVLEASIDTEIGVSINELGQQVDDRSVLTDTTVLDLRMTDGIELDLNVEGAWYRWSIDGTGLSGRPNGSWERPLSDLSDTPVQQGRPAGEAFLESLWNKLSFEPWFRATFKPISEPKQ